MTQVTLDPSSPRSSAPIAGGLTGAMLGRALGDAVVKLNPAKLLRNPVIFATWIVAVLATASAVVAAASGQAAGFPIQLALWLWATVLFANVAESIAEGRGKAAADSLRATRVTTKAKLIVDPKTGTVVPTPAGELEIGSIVLVEAGDVIPSDGEIIEGVASVNEAAITGESAPVIRESGGDRSAVTGGTRVLSDRIVVRITSKPGETFVDRMIALVEGASRQRTANELALNILLASLSIIFVVVVLALNPIASYAASPVSIPVLIALLVCLIPTTIGALLSAIGIAGMDRLVQRNVLAMSGRAVEAAGDVTTLLLDKTGTITYGNRRAHEVLPLQARALHTPGHTPACMTYVVTDDTPAEERARLEAERSAIDNGAKRWKAGTEQR